jgi:nucleoside-diphosphate-sugar epimerase
MTTLIVGVGIVGSQIARTLTEQGEAVVVMDPAIQVDAIAEIVPLDRITMLKGDVLRPFDLTRAILDHGITDVVHTAANPLLTLGAQQEPFSAIQLNIMGTMNVLEAARVHKLRRVVAASSSVLNHYMEGGERPAPLIKEEAFPRPVTFYAAAKQAVENLGLNYARWCNVDFAAMRYAAVCGPWRGSGGGGPSNMFRNVVEWALSGEDAIVQATEMEWVYSKDAARATVLALRADNLDSRIFNVTMGSITAPEDFAAALRKAIPHARIKLQPIAEVDLSMRRHRSASDPTLAREVLGFVPEFDIDAAVADMAHWLRQPKQRQPNSDKHHSGEPSGS